MALNTIIIALGGVGSQVTLRLAKLLESRHANEIKIFAIDTDANFLRTVSRVARSNINQDSQTGLSIETICISDNSKIDSLLRAVEGDNGEYSTFISFKNDAILGNMDLDRGAAKFRAVSNLGLTYKIKQQDNAFRNLDTAIDNLDLMPINGNPESPRIFIVSSFAGGTGSGLFLPIAMYIRKRYGTTNPQKNVCINGFFVLPQIVLASEIQEDDKNTILRNAYAAMREINAFTIKHCNDSEKNKYNFDLYHPIGGEYTSIGSVPFDFCYLLDYQNMNNAKLNKSEDYFDHGAFCLYNRISGSMKDSIASAECDEYRKLMRGKGKNRIAGIGSSKLIYPSAHLKKYFALNWAERTLKELWTTFDSKVWGVDFEMMSPESFISLVDEMALDPTIDEKKRKIAKSCKETTLSDNGVDLRLKYFECLQNFVNIQFSKYFEHDESDEDSFQTINENLENLKRDCGVEKAENFAKLFKSTIKYISHAKDKAKLIGNSLSNSFTGVRNLSKPNSDELHKLSYYITRNESLFMSPNATRYFLFHLRIFLNEKKASFEKLSNEMYKKLFKFTRIFEDNNENTGPDEEVTIWVKNLVETTETAIQHNAKWMTIRKATIPINTMPDKLIEFENVMTYIKQFMQYNTFICIIDAVISDISSICNAYDKFIYEIIPVANRISKECEETLSKKDNTDGDREIYVCASSNCIKNLSRDTKFVYPKEVVYNHVNFNETIYKEIVKYISSHDRKHEFFDGKFQGKIIELFEGFVNEKLSHLLDVNIVKAMIKEAELDSQGNTDFSQIESVLRDKFDSADAIASPFISKIIGQGRSIEGRAYNPAILQNLTPEQEVFFTKELNKGRVGSLPNPKNLSNEYEIVFYSAIYSIFPHALPKFSKVKDVKHKGTEGIYRKAYREFLENHSVIYTPHLKENWHEVMPDIEDTKAEEEKKVYKALVIGLIYEYIRYFQYCYWDHTTDSEIQLPNIEGDDACDKICEVIDHLNQPNNNLAKDIISKFTAKLAKKPTKTSTESRDINRILKDFKLGELRSTKKDSIFDIASRYLIDTYTPNFDVGKIITVTTLDVIFDHLGVYNSNIIEHKKDFAEIICDEYCLFKDKFNQHTTKGESNLHVRDKIIGWIESYMKTKLGNDNYIIFEKCCESKKNTSNAKSTIDNNGVDDQSLPDDSVLDSDPIE